MNWDPAETNFAIAAGLDPTNGRLYVTDSSGDVRWLAHSTLYSGFTYPLLFFSEAYIADSYNDRYYATCSEDASGLLSCSSNDNQAFNTVQDGSFPWVAFTVAPEIGDYNTLLEFRLLH